MYGSTAADVSLVLMSGQDDAFQVRLERPRSGGRKGGRAKYFVRLAEHSLTNGARRAIIGPSVIRMAKTLSVRIAHGGF